jgi:diguanylate cyclase (GGDEF)-like protein/PAS domain S-box-containing protein
MTRFVPAWLPASISLAPEDWARRHHAISSLAWLHAVLVPAYGLTTDQPALHVLGESSVIAVLAALTRVSDLSPRLRSLAATLALVAASALLVHFSGGLIEMHFHFFVVVAVISLYQSWLPFLTALGFVVLHHGVAGMLAPGTVYNHPSAVEHAWLWALVHGAFVLAESVACLVAWRLNETALAGERAARDDMARAHRDLARAQALASVGSWDWDLDADVVTWSDELYAIFGRDRARFVPALGSFLDHVAPHDRERVEALVEVALQGSGRLDFECEIVRGDGQTRVVHGLGERSAEGGVPRIIGTCQDITERTGLQREIERRTFHDALTGLPNRALFLDRLDGALQGTARSTDGVALLYLDLDDFKAINDNLGHAVGDEVLVELGRRLVASVRTGDTVARLGGDEFVLLLDGADVGVATRVAEQLLESLQVPLELEHGNRVARVSIGIAVAEEDEQPGDVLRRADIAMYAAKRQGTHCYRVFSDGMHASLTARMELEGELAGAITEGQLVVHYQPLVDLHSGRVDGVEALVRWDHPERGVLPPSEFIALAEEAGLISALGEWVLRQAAADVRRLQLTMAQDLYLSVNVAPAQLDTDIVATVRAALADTGLAPQHLLLELTESAIVTQNAVEKLTVLREMGVRIAIDDFGTGYSSLSYLKDLPVDHLKIDRSFVRDIASSADASALTLSIIHLAELFGLRIVGEGVETTEQADALRALGAHVGQGYLYSRPTDLESLIRSLGTAPRPPAPRTSTDGSRATTG